MEVWANTVEVRREAHEDALHYTADFYFLVD